MRTGEADDSPGMRRRRWWWAVILLVAIAAASWGPAVRHVRAASLLLRFASDQPGPLGAVGAFAVDEWTTTFPSNGTDVPGRLYVPRDRPRAPRLVLLHGVHRLGMDEPRLVRFARTLASAGVEVLTPQLHELADYRVQPSAIDTIGAAVHAMAAEPGVARVGVMGLSFAGALGLLAAADSRYAPEVGFVVAVGTHDDLSRVSRFFVLDSVQLPDGTEAPLKAHPYGALVLVYSHAADFFETPDFDGASDALRLWLWEQQDAARKRARTLSPSARDRLEALFSDHFESLRPELLACIGRNERAMAAVSPKGRLSGLRVPVLLVHGAGDTVIPSSETLWLSKDVPTPYLRDVLVSPTLQHVELGGHSDWKDQLALVHFMADVLYQTESTRP
jgi:pimeloyl-ACP methyl ester carboxylesterase